MKKVKLGIIGTGLAAKNLHLPALIKLQKYFEITAVCNHTEKKAKSFAKHIGGVPYYLDYKKMLKEANIDAVDIALPIELNYQTATESINAGKHVILEKPLAVNLNEAKKLVEVEKRTELVTMVAENFRYKKIFNKAKKYLEQDKIGKPYAAVWNLFNNVDEKNKYAQTDWRINHKYPGGFMTDAGVHNIAAIRMILGNFSEVSAFSKSINPAIGKPDTLSIQFKTNKNIYGIFNIFFSVKGHHEDRFVIFGENGTIEIDENKLSIKKKKGKTKVEELTEDFGYYEEFKAFHSSITKGEKVFSSFAEGYKDFEAAVIALKAADKNTKINFS